MEININVNTRCLPVSASTTSANATLLTTNNGALRVTNGTTAVAFVRSGNGTQTATTSDFPIAPNTTVVVDKDPNHTNVGVILSTGTGTVYVQAF